MEIGCTARRARRVVEREGAMREFRGLLVLLAAAATAAGEDSSSASAARPKGTALNRAFHGRIVGITRHRVTLFYDFEDPAQLRDFEEARPPRLLDASPNEARIEAGRLVLAGSSAIRHRIESAGGVEARFKVRVGRMRDVGAVITEPVLSDFYVVYNLFDYRFNGKGHMHIAACGLREDEGAEDPSTGRVNFRDIFSGNLQEKVEPNRDIEVEVKKEHWKEFFRAGDVKGKGSSKGKTKEMRAVKFGLFVHGSEAAFDDLTLVCELSDEYLAYENLRLAVDEDPPAPPPTR
jgi:hypothetical protein